VVLIRESGAEIRYGPLPTVSADRTQIAQLLQNLIENGIKYNRAKPPRVEIACQRRGAEWLFSVRDNGIGIDPRHHDRIFEIFRRLHTYAKVPGTGIGLALCRRIVERHHGRIWVESRPEGGSTFHFTLPAAPAGAATASPPA
jgi:light-regulated signal transduction histidine kinase (bacteriophytochrome)